MSAKRWAVYGTVVGSKYLGEYEAATKEEAEAKALDEAHVSFCHQCCGECENAEIDEVHAELRDDE